jgi:predicted secreted hydrolase
MSPSTNSPADPLSGLHDETRRSIADALWQRQLDVTAIDAATLAALTSDKHSPEGYGSRMRALLKYLIEHPLEHTPSYEKDYEHLLPFCDRLSPQQAYVMAVNFLGPAVGVGFDQIPNRADFRFPRDFGPKPRHQVGWHFFVGSCWDVDGQEYGVELMFFQSGLLPPPLAAGLGLSDDENQVVELQLAISVAGGGHYQADPVCLGGTSGLVTHTERPFTYRVGRNSMVCDDPEEFFPITVSAWGVDRGSTPARELGLDLAFTSGKTYLFQGAAGCMPANDGFGTFYYSIPNIQIDPDRSTLTLDGRTIKLARGEFWFDRQWGFLTPAYRSRVMRAAANTADPGPGGWDWFMAHLPGDRQVTVFAPHSTAMKEFYEQSGETPPGAMTVRVGGTYMAADKTTALTWGTLTVSEWIKATSSPNPERYAVTNTWYPNRWTFEFDEVVPTDIRYVTMTPIVNVAQVGYFAGSAQYAEGAVVLTDPSGADIGRGFAESVSYADTRANCHRLAGLPDSPAHVESLSHKTIPKALAVLNSAYVMAHQKELAEVISDAVGLDFFIPPESRT